MTNYWAEVSGKGNRINPSWRPDKKRKDHLSPLGSGISDKKKFAEDGIDGTNG